MNCLFPDFSMFYFQIIVVPNSTYAKWSCKRRLRNSVKMTVYLFCFMFKLYVYVCVCVWVCAHECKCWQRPERALGPPELELQMVLNHPTWILGTEFRSSARTLHSSRTWVWIPRGGFLKTEQVWQPTWNPKAQNVGPENPWQAGQLEKLNWQVLNSEREIVSVS